MKGNFQRRCINFGSDKGEQEAEVAAATVPNVFLFLKLAFSEPINTDARGNQQQENSWLRHYFLVCCPCSRFQFGRRNLANIISGTMKLLIAVWLCFAFAGVTSRLISLGETIRRINWDEIRNCKVGSTVREESASELRTNLSRISEYCGQITYCTTCFWVVPAMK